MVNKGDDGEFKIGKIGKIGAPTLRHLPAARFLSDDAVADGEPGAPAGSGPPSAPVIGSSPVRLRKSEHKGGCRLPI